MTDSGPTGDEILEVSRQHGLVARPLFAIRSEVADDMARVLETLETHLAYWAEMEDERVLFAAGPLMPEAGSAPWPGGGLIIIRADSLEQARRIADADPMHANGARTYTLEPWLLNHFVPD